ncbi:MAG: hypothetical protein JJT81_14860, partial [Rubellimicrobium sp.]|nr:hypothetical protein [Rubellimicrobium sp.]
MFSRTDLVDLVEAEPAVAVSLYLPMQVLGRETRQNPIVLKNLLGKARAQLAGLEITEAAVAALLAP